MKYAALIIGLLLLVGVGSADYWQITHILDSAYCGYYLDAVPDSLGNSHMFYFNNEEDTYNYILKTSSGYYSQTLFSDLPGYNTYKGSAVCDSNNEIHLGVCSEVSDASYTFYYMKRYTDGSWSSPEEIFSAGALYTQAYCPISIAVDDDDNPWLICGYSPYSGGWYCNVTVWHKDGSWDMDVIVPTTPGGSPRRLDITFNSANVPHIIYHPSSYGADTPFMYAYRKGDDTWVNSTITSTSSDTYYPHESNLYFIDDAPHVLYPVNGVPRHAVLDGTWSVTQNVPPTYVYLSSALRTSDNTLYMAGFDQDNGEHIYLSTKTPTGSWSSWEQITTLGGYSGSVFINPTTDNPNVFFASSSESSLYYAELIHTAGSCVNITGDVYYYNATKVGSGVTVAIQQDGEYYNVTTNATGAYSQIELETDKELLIWPVKTGYDSTPVNFTPLDCSIQYIADLVLVPDDLDFNSSAIGGIVYQKPFYEIDGGLTVNITNGTWSSSNLTNNVGFYLFTDLAGGEEYTLTASAPKHVSQSVNVTAVAGNFTQQDFILNESFALTVQVKDLDTGGLINDREVSVTLSSGASQNTTSGSAVFGGLTYQYYSIDTFAEGYYPGSGSTILDDDQTVIVYMQERADTSGSGINYEEHNVRFIVTNEFGMPISEATVTANAISSTTPWDWLNSWFGISTAVNIQNTTLSGSTGSEGSVVFPMVKSVNYQIDISKPSSGISHSVNVMPQESTYTIRVNTGLLPSVGGGYPRFNLEATENGSYVDLTMTYNDASNQTSAITFTVKDEEGNVVYQTNPTITAGAASATYTVENVRGTSRTFGFNASHSSHGEIQNWQGIDLKGTGRLIDLGFSDPLIYVWISLAIIFIFAGALGETDVKIGAFLVPILGGGTFWYIGWLPASLGLVIAIGASLGGVYYMRASESKVKS